MSIVVQKYGGSSVGDVSRIKQCSGDHCGWLFFDTTKNKQRRWCEMDVCGNRAKQKAHRARIQAMRTATR